MPVRIADLREQLRNLDREVRTLKDKERSVGELYRQADEESKVLHGQKLQLEGSHQEVQKDY